MVQNLTSKACHIINNAPISSHLQEEKRHHSYLCISVIPSESLKEISRHCKPKMMLMYLI